MESVVQAFRSIVPHFAGVTHPRQGTADMTREQWFIFYDQNAHIGRKRSGA
jgi:hypothetical protein